MIPPFRYLRFPCIPCRQSLRRQLLLTLLGAILGVFLFMGMATYYMARRQIDAIMDYHLSQLALSLRGPLLERDGRGLRDEEGQVFDMVIQIWNEAGARLYLSRPFTDLPDQAQLGYATVLTPKGRWRTYSIIYERHVIQVAQPMSSRNRLAADAALGTLMPLLFILPVVGMLIWYLVGRGLQPLEVLARVVRTRQPDALAPLSDKGVPEEAQPLVEALNGLLCRLDQAMATQRAFVADAAHELRTPLAALYLQLQLTERATTEAERQAALHDFRLGLKRATRVIEQLLILARQVPEAGRTTVEKIVCVDMTELVADVMAGFQPLAEAKNIDLGVDQMAEGLVVMGQQEALRALLGNLVDNAIRYTPEGGRVDVSAWAGTNEQDEPARIWLEVADNGPGVPEEERERIFDRFYRRPGQSEAGSGLGLAIVKAVAEYHAARLVLSTASLGGLSIRVGLPFHPPAQVHDGGEAEAGT